jgi:hypothetical protein
LPRFFRRKSAFAVQKTQLDHDPIKLNRIMVQICSWSMIFSDLPSPAEAGFAKAGNRFPPPIKSGAGFFGIML